MMDTCICCGAPVLEGRMVCGACEITEKREKENNMDLQQLNVAIAEIKGDVNRNTGRIKTLEQKTDAVTKLAEAVAVMAEHMRTLDDKIDGMQQSVNNLTAKPGRNWDALVKIALTALVSGLVGWALSKIL